MFGREFLRTLRELWTDASGRAVLLTGSMVLAVGTIFYRLVEGWSWLDSLYFTVVTLTTVGYGDLSPTKDISKVFTIVFILGGVGFILSLLNFIMVSTARRRGISKD